MTEYADRLISLLLPLRSPLTQIELAVGWCERDDPAQKNAMRSIREAVDRIDQQLDGIVRVLRANGEEARSDGREVFAELANRLAPALAARGLALEVKPSPPHTVPVHSAQLRRALVRLLRVLGRWLGEGGTLRVGLIWARGRAGIDARCARQAVGVVTPWTVEELERLSWLEGAELDLRASSDCDLELQLWLAPETEEP